MNRIITAILFMVAVYFAAPGCKKTKDAIPPLQGHFANNTTGTFYVKNLPNATYKIPVGITAASDKDTKVNISVSSPTGAQAGVQYSLPSSTLVIPAGKTIDSFPVIGIFAGFPGNRRDTLIFTISGGDASPSDYNKTFTLIMQRYCDVNLTSFSGTYANTNDNDGSPVYSSSVGTITAANQTGPTTGYILVSNLWNPGVATTPIRVNLDWTDPGNFKTDIPTGQPIFIHPTYGQAFVRPVGSGTFSSCANTFTLKYQVYVSVGAFTATTTTVAR
jgi:hypothetical protein